MQRTPVPSTEGLLRVAHDLVAEEYDADYPMLSAAQHLIACAADMVALLPSDDLESAREALACARAATGIAGYIVVRMGDDIRARPRR
jgi:hypothetical protein